MSIHPLDLISPETLSGLHSLFLTRAKRSPKAVAYRYFDTDAATWRGLTWQAMWRHVVQWRDALSAMGLQAGDRVGVMLRNSPQWVMFEQASLALGLVVVPLYPGDRAANVNHVVRNAGIKLLLVESAVQWRALESCLADLELFVLSIESVPTDASTSRVLCVNEWLEAANARQRRFEKVFFEDVGVLASVIYTSGVSGPPKGVTLTHANILANVSDGLQRLPVFTDDVFLSVLPLANGLERSIGLYAPMMAGATVVFGRGEALLAEDLIQVQPTIVIAAPRFFARLHRTLLEFIGGQSAWVRAFFPSAVRTGWRRFERLQRGVCFHPSIMIWPLLGRFYSNALGRLSGGNLRAAICGGAPLSPGLSRDLLALGVPLLQGYGLTEAGPVVSFNSAERNDPASVGAPLQTVEVRLQDGEIQVRGPSVSRGYWNNPEATREAFATDGWLRTGDLGRFEGENLFLTGRRREMIALTSGEKVSPGDLEAAIIRDALVDYAMVVGDGRPHLTAVLAVNPGVWESFAKNLNCDPANEASLTHSEVQYAALLRANLQMSVFPGHVKIHQVILSRAGWTVENGRLTPSGKVCRATLLGEFEAAINQAYGEDEGARIVRLARQRRRAVR